MKINPCCVCGSEAKLAGLICYCMVKCTNPNCNNSGMAFDCDYDKAEAKELAIRCWNFVNRF